MELKQKQNQPPQARASRLPKWDNLKGLLIFLVVIGHFIQNGAQEQELRIFRTLFTAIYSFHIPLFIFITGLFYKRSSNEKLKTDRIWYYLVLYILMKAILLLVKRVLTGEGSFQLLTEGSTPWYMFAIAVYMWLAYVVRYRKPQLILPMALLLGILAGYDKSIGDDLVLSRILVFAPFFFLGYYLEPEKLTAGMEQRSCKIVAAVILVLLAAYCILYVDDAYVYRALMTGRNAYANCTKIPGCSGWNRLLLYGVTLAAGGVVAVLMPNRQLPLLTVMGQRSLAVYFWHRPLLYILDHYEVGTWIRQWGIRKYQIIWIAIAVLLTIVCSARMFEAPLQWLSKVCKSQRGQKTAE